MNLDIRLPIGLMFTLLGVLLFIYGLLTHGDPMYAHSLNINVNIGWGLVLAIFGALMTYYGARAKNRPLGGAQETPPAPDKSRRGH